MANAQRRLLTAVLFLLFGFALGCASTHAERTFIKKKGIHVVVVGPKAKDLAIDGFPFDELHISYAANEVAFWVSKQKGKKLYIEFDKEVFENMTRQSSGRWRVNCQKRMCYSDEIKLYDPNNPANNYFKYWQILDDGTTQDTEDGIIIIDP